MKKILFIILIALLLVPQVNLSATADEIANIEQLEDGVFTIGTDCAYAPYAFAEAKNDKTSTAVPISGNNGYCDGYDIIIAQSIADYLDVNLEVKVISFDGLVPALNSGQIDAIISGMSATPERKQELDFTENYYNSNLVMSVVLSTNSAYKDAKTKEDLDGANLSSQMGTFHGEILKDIDNVNIANELESVDALMQATKSGTIDGYITEHEAAVAQAQSSEDLVYLDLNDLEIDPGFSGVAIAVKKDSPDFIKYLNEAINEIPDSTKEQYMEEATAKGDGTYDETKDVGFLAKTWNLFVANKGLYLNGIAITLILAVFGTLFGILLGFVLVGMRIQEVHYKDNVFVKIIKKTLNIIAIVYIDLIRGTPMMVQAMLFFYGIAADIMSPNVAGVIIISFNTGAYIAEILRGGIHSLDKGQTEAGRSLGLSNIQTFIYIIIPQTIKNTLPALANQLILNIKDSSVLSVIAVSELFYTTKQAASAGYQYTEAYLISAIIYLILTIVLARLLNIIIRKLLNNNNVEDIMSLQSIEEAVSND